jgi:hypothetical protein
MNMTMYVYMYIYAQGKEKCSVHFYIHIQHKHEHEHEHKHKHGCEMYMVKYMKVCMYVDGRCGCEQVFYQWKRHMHSVAVRFLNVVFTFLNTRHVMDQKDFTRFFKQIAIPKNFIEKLQFDKFNVCNLFFFHRFDKFSSVTCLFTKFIGFNFAYCIALLHVSAFSQENYRLV